MDQITFTSFYNGFSSEFLYSGSKVILDDLIAIVKKSTYPRNKTRVVILACAEIITKVQSELMSEKSLTAPELKHLLKLCTIYMKQLDKKKDDILELNQIICKADIYDGLYDILDTLQSMCIICIDGLEN
jgi:hypothetical protein